MSVVAKINEFPQFKLSDFDLTTTFIQMAAKGSSIKEEFTHLFNERFFDLPLAAREEIRLVQKGITPLDPKVMPEKTTAKKVAETAWTILSSPFFQLGIVLAMGYVAYSLCPVALGLGGKLAATHLLPVLTSHVSASTTQIAATALSYKWTITFSSLALGMITHKTSLGKWVFKPVSIAIPCLYFPSYLAVSIVATSRYFIQNIANKAADVALGRSLIAAREKWVEHIRTKIKKSTSLEEVNSPDQVDN